MSRQPQQPELRRSGKGATGPDSAKAKADNRSFDRDRHPTPPGNRPSWEQAPVEDTSGVDDA
jgi:hypothetical protein